MLRYSNFEPRFKLQWCRARDLFESQISVTTFQLKYSVLWPSGSGNYFVRTRFTVHNLLWLLEQASSQFET